jgi:hypothetical protein
VFAALARWEVQQRRILDLARALDAEGVAAAFLKGTDLNLRAYPQPGLRPMNDIDVLVAPERIETAAGLFAGLGYVPRSLEGLTAADTAFEHTFVSGDGFLELDMHFALGWQDVVRVSVDELLERREWAGPGAVPVLDRGDLLLHLATHALRDLARPAVVPVVDACFVLGALRPDLEVVASRARAWGIQGALDVLVHRLRRFARVEVSCDVTAPGLAGRLVAEWVGRHLWPPHALRRAPLKLAARLALMAPGRRLRQVRRYVGLRRRPPPGLVTPLA